MGKLMIKCPKTGDAIFTGLTADKERFAVMPVFFGRAFCAACGATHEWFARDAWVHDDPPVPRGSFRTGAPSRAGRPGSPTSVAGPVGSGRGI